jgi:hypothetical protein
MTSICDNTMYVYTSLTVGSINVRIGDDLFLDCSVQNVDLNSNFQWHINGLPLEETETVMNTTSSRLVVKNISNSDLGHYECTYNNISMRGNNVNESGIDAWPGDLSPGKWPT